MSDVRELLARATAILAGDEARQEAELLLAHTLGRSRAWLFAWPEFVPEAAQASAYGRLVAARRDGMPIAYLTGTRGFRALELTVTPAVLIPRPETELLVEWALACLPAAGGATVADLGTGSGAIALAIAQERPATRVVATDASADALAVARANAQRLGLANVEFMQGDWCAALGTQVFDLIVSNPPYIEADDPHLTRGDLRFEPPSALASGADGLDAIRTISAQAPAHLREGGWLMFEHGWNQGAAVRGVLEEAFDKVETVRDLEGRGRVTGGRLRR